MKARLPLPVLSRLNSGGAGRGRGRASASPVARMRPERMLTYAVAAAVALAGLGLLTGLLAPAAEPTVRVTFGVVLLLFAVYRVVAGAARERDHG